MKRPMTQERRVKEQVVRTVWQVMATTEVIADKKIIAAVRTFGEGCKTLFKYEKL